MVTIAAEIISQTKWVWFWSASPSAGAGNSLDQLDPNSGFRGSNFTPVGGGRPLKDFDAFDNASRGVWGAINLVPVVLFRCIPTMMMVLVVIVSFAVGPFVQQAIQTVERDFPIAGSIADNTTASLPVAHFYDDYAGAYYRLAAGTWDVTGQIRSNLLNAVASFNDNATSIAVSCSTGNCTFPSLGRDRPGNGGDGGGDQAEPDEEEATHASLGLCSSCFDVSSLVTTLKGSPNVMGWWVGLPNGLNVSNQEWQPHIRVSSKDWNLTWAQEVIPDLATPQPKFRWALTNVTVLSLTRKNTTETYPQDYVAVSCSIYACLRTYSARVSRGILHEKLIRSTPFDIDGGDMYPADDTMPGLEEYVNEAQCTPGSGFYLTAIQSPCRVTVSSIKETPSSSNITESAAANNATSSTFVQTSEGLGTIYTLANMSDLVDHSPPEPTPDEEEDQFTMPKENTANTLPINMLDPAMPKSAPNECVYRMSCFMKNMLGAVLNEELLYGDCTWNMRQEYQPICDGGSKWWLDKFWHEATASFESISGHMDKIATAATNAFRLGAFPYAGVSQFSPKVPPRVFGVAHQLVSVTVVDWRWLVFPVGLLAIEVGVLVWVIIRSWVKRDKEMVWKSSSLPLLFYGRELFLPTPLQDEGVVYGGGGEGKGYNSAGHDNNGVTGSGRLMTTSELATTCKDIRVAIRSNSEGGKDVAEDAEGGSYSMESIPMKRRGRRADVEVDSLWMGHDD